MLSVVEGTEKKSTYDLYYQAYKKVLIDYKNNPDKDIKPFIKKVVLFGVKAVNTKRKPEVLTRQEAKDNFEFIENIRILMSSLTPIQFMNIFPINKEYDGDKWQCKDYRYTMNYIRGLEQDKPIGEEIDNFLWEYHNFEVKEFLVHLISCMSDLRRLDGLPGVAEEWAIDNGIKYHTMHTDNKGKKYLYDSETGKTAAVKRKIPRYLKLIN